MTSNMLKLIAIICMVADHIGYLFFPEHLMFRLVGRLAFPIFAFCIAEGYRRTKNVRKYMLRLAAFALISEVPFDLFGSGKVVDFEHQNVFFTLFFGLLAIYIYDRMTKEKRMMAAVLALALICGTSIVLRTDYSFIGVLMVFIFFVCKYRAQVIGWMSLLVALNALMQYFMTINMYGGGLLWSLAQLAMLAALPLILAYNGKQGLRMKYLLYTVYPAHMLLLYVLKKFVFT